jgi:hypothetical protein
VDILIKKGEFDHEIEILVECGQTGPARFSSLDRSLDFINGMITHNLKDMVQSILESSRSVLNQKEVLGLKVNFKQSWRTKNGLSSFSLDSSFC